MLEEINPIKIGSMKTKIISSLIRVLLVMLLSVNVGYAQTTEATTTQQLPETLTKQSVADLLSTLSDKEVRGLLKKQLDGLAEEQARAVPQKSLAESLTGAAGQLFGSWSYTFSKVPDLFSSLNQAYQSFRDGRVTLPFLVKFFGLFALGLAIAWAVEKFVIHFLLKGPRNYIYNSKPETLWQTITVLTVRLGLYIAVLSLFYLVASYSYKFLYSFEKDIITADTLLTFIFYARLFSMFGAFLLAPYRPDLRLCNVSDESAKALVNRIVIVGILSLSGTFLAWTWAMGLKPGEARIGFWTNVVFFIALIWAVWLSRKEIAQILLSSDTEHSKLRIKFANAWPMVVMVGAGIVWLLQEYILSFPNPNFAEVGYTFVTLLLFISLPLIDLGLTAVVRELYQVPESADEHIIAAREKVQQSLVRVSRVIASCIGVFVLASVWGVDLGNLAEQGLGAQFAAALVEIILLLLISYLIWELIRTSINYYLALEEPEGPAEQEMDSEGGEAGSRLSTLLPILQKTATVLIVVLTIIGALSILKVNIAPLLAGVGVLGLAIGFGAQTLVKDIVSGVFFLIDDAFRMGEYVDTGDIKGTVEKIALRSLRLRHHLGALHTIPYGEIARLTNYSRDWVIMKLRFQVPHDTDINKIKKLFKKLGQELLEHPELGEDFIQPFKSQGVLEVDEIGMVVRGKFMCKPGKQFMIRKEIYVQVKRIFEENGIEFAKRRVEVQMPEGATPDQVDAITAAATELADRPPAGGPDTAKGPA